MSVPDSVPSTVQTSAVSTSDPVKPETLVPEPKKKESQDLNVKGVAEEQNNEPDRFGKIYTFNSSVACDKMKGSLSGSTSTVPFRSNGIRSDCFPENEKLHSSSTLRYDCPFSQTYDIDRSGKKIEHKKIVGDVPFVPFIGLMNQETRDSLVVEKHTTTPRKTRT